MGFSKIKIIFVAQSRLEYKKRLDLARLSIPANRKEI
jgi:hypothetical protein